MSLNLILLLLKLTHAASSQADAGVILGCDPKVVTSGFTVSYYSLPLIGTKSPCYNPAYSSSAYLHGGYQTLGSGLLGTSSGVTNLTFDTGSTGFTSCGVVNQKMPSNYNFDKTISTSNFSMLMTGYFYAPTTGTYSLNLASIDDLAYINVGAGNAFNCCQISSSVSNPGNFSLYAIWPQTQNYVTIGLVGGYYYPLRVFYVNRNYIGGMKFYFTTPDGVLHTDWTGYIFSAQDGARCDVQPKYSTTFSKVT